MGTDNLYTRREFFKRVAKVLPLFTLAAIPSCSIATKMVKDCNNSCAYSCKGSCNATCYYTCSSTCRTLEVSLGDMSDRERFFRELSRSSKNTQ